MSDMKLENSKKIYYTMGEVAEMFDVNASLIRFWEQKFDILKPDKNKKGNRLFTPTDVENLKLIYHLVKENGMTLAGAEKKLKENREGVTKNLEIIEKLQGVKALLLEVKQELRSADEQTVEIFVEEELPGAAKPLVEEVTCVEVVGALAAQDVQQTEDVPNVEPTPVTPDPPRLRVVEQTLF